MKIVIIAIVALQLFFGGFLLGDQLHWARGFWEKLKAIAISLGICLAGALAVPAFILFLIGAGLYRIANYFCLPFIINRIIFKIPIRNFDAERFVRVLEVHEAKILKWYQVNKRIYTYCLNWMKVNYYGKFDNKGKINAK